MRFILSLLTLSYLHVVTSMFCYWNTGCPYKYFGAKTPYNFVRGDIRDSLVKITGESRLNNYLRNFKSFSFIYRFLKLILLWGVEHFLGEQKAWK